MEIVPKMRTWWDMSSSCLFLAGRFGAEGRGERARSGVSPCCSLGVCKYPMKSVTGPVNTLAVELILNTYIFSAAAAF